jgi:hypothetical protein
VEIGSTFTDMIIAESQCPGERITDIIVIGLTGSKLSPLMSTSVSSQKYVNMTWTPVQSQFGPNVICASATDSSFLVSFNCYTVLAGYSAPSPIRNTGSPTVSLHSNSFNTEWSVECDQLILKADKSSFIRFYDKNGSQIYSLDAFILAFSSHS